MAEKFKDMVPPVTEMEKILAKRKDPKERERVLTFYDTVAQNIVDELDGIVINSVFKLILIPYLLQAKLSLNKTILSTVCLNN